MRELEASRLRLFGPRTNHLLFLASPRDRRRSPICGRSGKSFGLRLTNTPARPIAGGGSAVNTSNCSRRSRKRRRKRPRSIGNFASPSWPLRCGQSGTPAPISIPGWRRWGPWTICCGRRGRARMERIRDGLALRRRKRLVRLNRQRRPLETEAAGLIVREALWRNAPRIHALVEHESVGRVGIEEELRTACRSDRGSSRIAAGRKPQATLETCRPPPVQAMRMHNRGASSRRPGAHRRPSKCMPGLRKRPMNLGRPRLSRSNRRKHKRREIEQALAAKGQKELGPALEQAGQLVSQLRRRVQIDDRLDRMTRQHADLEEPDSRAIGAAGFARLAFG